MSFPSRRLRRFSCELVDERAVAGGVLLVAVLHDLTERPLHLLLDGNLLLDVGDHGLGPLTDAEVGSLSELADFGGYHVTPLIVRT
jgi:hypothetical protein